MIASRWRREYRGRGPSPSIRITSPAPGGPVVLQSPLSEPRPGDATRTYTANFHGNGWDLFAIGLQNGLLTMLTLGIYAPWARVRQIRYMTDNAEFAGIWEAPQDASYPRGDAAWEEFHDGCRTVVAEYAGIPDDANLQYRTGVVSLPGNADVWTQGDHGVRCYLWLDGASLTESLKGKGTKALPVQYK